MKVLLIDDHPLILQALQNVIQGLGSHVSVVGVSGARAAREALGGADFDLTLLDLHLGDADGFELLIELRATWPQTPVVVVSASDRSADVIRAIDLGAMGFVPKRASNDILTEALNVVMSGGIYVPPMAIQSEVDGVPGADGTPAPPTSDAAVPPAGADAATAPALSAFKLTPRQTDVLGLLLRGQSNKLIARELNLSVETVKDHVAAVLRTLGVNSRTQAVLAVSQMASHGSVAPWLQRPMH